MIMTPLTVPRRSLVQMLAEHISGLIEREAYRIGDTLPPIAEIARLCGVSPPTVRAALARLEAVGMVEARQGSGVYVRSRSAR